jgi:hypothetical protein
MSIMTLSSSAMGTPVRYRRRPLFKQLIATVALVLLVVSSTLAGSSVEAKGTRGRISGRSIAAGALSLIVWPGIGQAVNSQPGKKVATHAVLGLFPPYRFWSGYDALFDRQGGYVEGKI